MLFRSTREVANHSYDNGCDSICNNCGFVRDVEGHKFDDPCDASCNNCSATRNVPGHSGGEATCKELAVCEICGKGYGSTVPHTYSEEWYCDGLFHWKECTMCHLQKAQRQRHNLTDFVYDATEHYKKCTVCNNDIGRSNHWYDNDCDKICNECGARRDIDHDWDEGQVIKEPSRSQKGETLYTCQSCGLERTDITPETGGCGGGDGLFIAFFTNSAIALVWFALKKKH